MSEFPSEAPGARVPMLFRHLGFNLALGAAFGVGFTAFLLASNAAGLGDLVAGTSNPVLAVVMLGFMNVLTFGSLAMGTSIMSLPREIAIPRDPDEEKPLEP